jgi:YD repeat-containing protein
LELNWVLKITHGYYDDTPGGYYGRLWKIKTTKQPGNNSILQDVQHTWDAAGNLTQRDDVVGLATEYLEYDPLDRLTSPASAAVVYSPGEHCAKFLYWK